MMNMKILTGAGAALLAAGLIFSSPPPLPASPATSVAAPRG